MNIFATSPCPRQSAKYLDDKRVNKMILESVQMLATALHHYQAPETFMPISQAGTPYKPTHKNHPCSIWVRESSGNYLWLVEHTKALCAEYEQSFHKTHSLAKFIDRLTAGAITLPQGNQTPFANCSLYQYIDDVHLAYRKTMWNKWRFDKQQPRFTNRIKPEAV